MATPKKTGLDDVTLLAICSLVIRRWNNKAEVEDLIDEFGRGIGKKQRIADIPDNKRAEFVRRLVTLRHECIPVGEEITSGVPANPRGLPPAGAWASACASVLAGETYTKAWK